MADAYEALRLERQLCFRLYNASREVTRLYRPYLDPLGLTYPQYLAMLVLWEAGEPLSVGELGERLGLESNTLTPMLKKLAATGRVRRTRSTKDERVLLVSVTDEGWKLRERALGVPGCVYEAMGVNDRTAVSLAAALDAFSNEMHATRDERQVERTSADVL